MFTKLVYSNDRMQIYENEKGWPRMENTACPGGAIVVQRPNGAILMVNEKRALSREKAPEPIWNIPRGGTEPGETPKQTARRELREETGLDLPEYRFKPLVRVRPDTGMFMGYVETFLVELKDDEALNLVPLEGEIESLDWFPLERLQEMLIAGELQDGYTLSTLGALALLKLNI